MPQRLGAILAIALAMTMSSLDTVITNVALPSIANELHATPGASIWIVNAYQLAVVTMLLPLSSLGDRIGYRKIFLSGLALFVVTSLACALSTSLTMLTLARVAQGLGAAAAMSVNIALVRLIYPRRLLGRGMGVNSLVVAVATAAGPSIAAAILSFGSWPWLFAVNVPICLTGLWLGWRYLPNNEGNRDGRFDTPSAVFNALTFGMLFLGLSGFAQGHHGALVWTELCIAAAVGVVFVRRESGQANPLFPVDLLRIPIFSMSMCSSIFAFAAQMLGMVSLPFMFQRSLGLSEVATGLLMTPWPIATMVMAPIAGRLIGRVHAGLLGGVGMLLFATGLFLLAWMPASTGSFGIGLRMLICGAGFGLFQSPNNHTIVTAAPAHRSGGASGMLGTARLAGQTSGAALAALAFNFFANGNQVALILAGGFACLAIVASTLRVTQPAPATRSATTSGDIDSPASDTGS